MQIYQGVDIIEMGKFRNLFLNNNLLEEIFSEGEREYCLSKRDPWQHFAGRFAAKEAAMKALGMGMSGTGIDSTFREIEVLAGPSGKPSLSFSGWTEKMSKKKLITQLTVSISHSENYAVATVILTGRDKV